MKRYYILVATGLGFIVCLLMWCSSRLCAVTDNITTDIMSMSSNDELFVFIGHGKAVLTGRRLRLWLERLSFIPQFPKSISDDLLIVHFSNGKILKYDLKAFGYSGSPFVYSNQVYWGRGGISGSIGPNAWRWGGSKFVPLAKDEASKLDHEHIPDVDEATMRSGWTQKSFLLRGRETETTIPLGDKGVKLYAEVEVLSGGKDRARVMLVQLATTNSPETLIDIIEGYREVGKKEYLRFVAEAANESTNGGRDAEHLPQ